MSRPPLHFTSVSTVLMKDLLLWEHNLHPHSLPSSSINEERHTTVEECSQAPCERVGTHSSRGQPLGAGHREAQLPVCLSVQLVRPQEAGACEQQTALMMHNEPTLTSRGQPHVSVLFNSKDYTNWNCTPGGGPASASCRLLPKLEVRIIHGKGPN